MKRAIIIVLAALAALSVSFLLGEQRGRMKAEIVERVDTVRFRDTVTITKPGPASTTLVGHDTLIFYVSDTVAVPVPIPIVSRTYEGTDYKAVVSGYEPSLDEISVFPETVQITTTRTVTKPVPYKWTISPFAGVDIARDNFAARVGVEWRRQVRGPWSVYLRGGYEVRNTSLTTGPFAGGGVRWDLFHD